jgi:transcriptional regulator with XRE-family HTH domain
MATRQNHETKTDLLFVEDIEVEQGVLPVDAPQPATNNPSAEVASSVPQLASVDTEALCAISLGERLRQARLAKGFSVADIAQTLNFQTNIVRSIEAGDLKALPTSYEVGFFRTYAKFVGETGLGVGIADAVEAIRGDFQPAARVANDIIIGQVEEESRRGIWVKVALGIILVAGMIAWFSWPEGMAGQTTTLGADDVPVQYTFNLQADH